MISKVFRIAYFVLFAALVGCANLAPLLPQPTPAPVALATSTSQPFSKPTQTALPAKEARVLRIWLPPRFDPDADTASAKLLKRQLIDFEATHPSLKIDVRIKAEDGLLNSLSITSAAAPTALPDLIALPRPDLEAAALKGLIHPIDGLSTVLDDPNWYSYARELGHIQNIGYGLPFAGDALVLIHRPELEITTWENILPGEDVFVFPASDPQALVLLSLYISAGGRIVNEQGLPTLDEDRLTQTLLMIQNGHLIEQAFLPAMANYETDTPSIQAYRDGRANTGDCMGCQSYQAGDGIMQTIPSLNSTPHTFANGWIWALAGSDPENQQVATELAEFLMADEFISKWLNETSYLPTRLF